MLVRPFLLINRLLTRSVVLYGQGEKLLRKYMESRFSITEQQLVNTVAQLSKYRVNPTDQRLINLRTTIERKMGELQLQSRIKLAWSFVKMRQTNKIVEELLGSLKNQVKHLDFGEVVTVMWVLAKAKQQDVKYILELTKRAQELLQKEGVKLIVGRQPRDDKQPEQDEVDHTPNDKETTLVNIKVVDCVTLLWSIASQNLTDANTFDLVLKKHLLPNLQLLTPRMLTIALYSCVRVSYQKKCIQRLYQQIKTRKLEGESVLTLKLLAQTCSKLGNIDPQFMDKVATIIISKHKQAKQMSPKFAVQLLMSLTQQGVTNSKILEYFFQAFFQNIVNSNGIDCVMMLCIVYREPFRNIYKHNLKELIKRIEKLYSSLNGKSKKILREMSVDPQFPSKYIRERVLQDEAARKQRHQG